MHVVKPPAATYCGAVVQQQDGPWTAGMEIDGMSGVHVA